MSHMPESRIYVALLNEGADVWRPVAATHIDDVVWQIDDQLIPDDEEWQFRPGSMVAVAERRGDRGSYLIAVKLLE